MDRQTELGLIERILDYVEERSTDMIGETGKLPVDRYYDPERFEKERDIVFGTLPRAVGHVSQIPGSGDFFTVEAGDQPLLVVRRADGGLNAFLNVCRHRGARLEWEAQGRGRKHFVCRYHGWSYNTEGELVGLPGAAGFPDLTRELHGLKRLAVEERHGFVWVHPTPGVELDVADYLGELDGELSGFGLESHVHHAPRRFTKRINWKLVIDTFLEGYHVNSAHAATIAPMFLNNIGTYDRFGMHQRTVFPKKSIRDLRNSPAENWRIRDHANILYVLFPNTMVLVQPDHMAVFHGYPDGIDGVVVDAYVLLPEHPDTHKAAAYWQKNIDILFGALEEDFDMAESVQAGVRSGANETLTFGRFEQGLSWFHENVDRTISGQHLP